MKSTQVLQLTYWSSVMVANAQVFLGIAAATFFTGELDQKKVLVVLSNVILSALCWYSGWRLTRYD